MDLLKYNNIVDYFNKILHKQSNEPTCILSEYSRNCKILLNKIIIRIKKTLSLAMSLILMMNFTSIIMEYFSYMNH